MLYFQSLQRLCDQFWTKHPALFYGLCWYLGSVSAISFDCLFIIPCGLLLFPSVLPGYSRLKKRLFLGFVCGCMAYFYCTTHVQFPPASSTPVQGEMVGTITDICPANKYGKSFYRIRLSISSFAGESEPFYACNIPAIWTCHAIADRPVANFRYRVKVTLREYNGTWIVKPIAGSTWEPLSPVFSLVEWRLRAKAFMKQLFAKYMPPGEARAFLEGVFIGQMQEASLASDLRRCGLQHLLVVSGFHFSMLATLCTFLLRLVLPWRLMLIALGCITTAYLCFVGLFASVLRSWCAVCMMLLAQFLGSKSNGLNVLGISLIVVLVLEPAWAISLSFQLSFLATGAILLLYPFCQQLTRKIFVRHELQEVLGYGFFEQMIVVLGAFLSSALALVMAVSLAMLPMSLLAFHSFPLMGIVYNCFFPFAVSIAVSIVCVAMLFLWLPPVASWLFAFADGFTANLLTLVTHAPTWLDISVRADIACSLVVLALSLLFVCGMWVERKKEGSLVFI